jgi:hypothetical protein
VVLTDKTRIHFAAAVVAAVVVAVVGRALDARFEE